MDTRDELLRQGHLACPGCGLAVAMRLVLSVLGQKTIVVIIPSCEAVISATYPLSALKVPAFHSAFVIAGATASGISRALKIRGEDDITVLAFAGDGGTYDIGLQSLSGAAERNEDFIYVCLDNEAYMNTGIQASSSTPYCSWTITTPKGKREKKKKLMDIIVAHSVPYAATATIGYPEDLMEKVKKAKALRGTRFIHILAPCPTGWRMKEDLTGIVSILASETKVFPLYEVYDGEIYKITKMPKGLPVRDYLSIQGRFSHLKDEDIEEIQRNVDREWERLMYLVKRNEKA
ncbi:MAG: thiamine pyrophosphate-dependent enzyme [Deltaproteobacteria bacterium]|nr:thiamine pyrophosphate-dependent enzyme [Deltaproteobacteria bacterium]